MHKQIQVSCEKTDEVIASKSSTKIFEKLVWKLNISNNEAIISIFKKLKNKKWISESEASLFSLFLEHRNLYKAYQEISNNMLLINSERNSESIDFWMLKAYLLEILMNSKLLTVLQNERYRSRIVEVEWKRGVCVLDKRFKQHFYEIIGQKDFDEDDKRSEYYVWKDIRSWKYVVFNGDTFEIVFESKNEIILQNGCFDNMLIDSYSHTHIFDKSLVTPFWSHVKYYEDRYHYYIVDFRWNRIHRVDKKQGTVWVEIFPEYDLKDAFWPFLIISLKRENDFKIMKIDGICQDIPWWDSILEYEILEWWDILQVRDTNNCERFFSLDGEEIK